MPTAHKRGASGRGAGRDNTKEAKFWLSYKGGPDLIHKVGGDCHSEPEDTVAGYSDDFDNVVDQGFTPCPDCMGG